MPRLVFSDSTGKQHSFPLKRKLITIGRTPGNDLVLPDLSIAGTHAHILNEASGFVVSAMDPKAVLLVNGKPRKTQSLRPDDQITLGAVVLTFRMDDVPAPPPPPPAAPARAAAAYPVQASGPVSTGSGASPSAPASPTAGAYTAGVPTAGTLAATGNSLPGSRARRETAFQFFPQLLRFSETVLNHQTSEELFRTLLDQVIEITGADKGMLVLVQDGRVQVPVARNMDKSNLDRNTVVVSDSILKQAMEKGEPLIVSDAIHDERFSAAQSVVDLKLSSVMCVPLIFRNQVLGALYLGNDRVAGLFTTDDLEVFKIYAGQAALILHNAQLMLELFSDNNALKEELKATSFGRILGQSEPMRRITRTIEKLANTDISVMIRGETGTGKELIARELHSRSSRRDKPFISINCGAIPEQLLESELFGHVKGSFTGAVTNRVGKFEAADGGTIFLDEIGEMPASLQVKLLRVLQERCIDKVGENFPVPVDIRVISATHRDLEVAIKEGNFREDLFYRLNEIEIPVPPLRERGEDILLIARYLLDKFTERYPNRKLRGFSKEALTAMRSYFWPGNVRQLENRIRKAVVMCEGPQIGPEDLELAVTPPQIKVRPLADAQADFTLQYIRQVLEVNNWNKTKTARDLDVDPRTIFRYLEKIDEQSSS